MRKRNADFRPVEHDEFFNGSETYPPGLALWRHDEHGVPIRLIFGCPCGCGTCAGVTVKPFPNGWEFNGDKLKPTLQPSIDINRGHWHGWLTDGVFREQ